MRKKAGANSDHGPRFVSFHGQKQSAAVRASGAQEFALSIRAIREIRGDFLPLLHAPPYIKGMINLRGSVLAIINLAERLGLPSARLKDRPPFIVKSGIQKTV
ncbi:chemotaxis protein CheW [Acidocella sp.]|jgi:purine-binding chemotaxis protein CheW|uniref:chemotaxis protein CheW n=1 Tax=Acidocella sp. TaxID=50710 RepID=UPI002F3F76FC